MKLSVMLALSVIFGISSAWASPKQFYFQKFNEAQTSPTDARSVESHTFDQLIDHSNPKDQKTFKQRWYLNQDFASSKDAPVILYICGESTCNASAASRGVTAYYGKKYNSIIIALEHRYYGKSQPFDRLSPANLKHLTTDNAIEDIARFQKAITKKFGFQKRWITIGGSYPGNLSAYYRLKYPKLVLGALASSAPVQADDNFDEYDRHVSKVVGEECGKLMNQTVEVIEKALGDKAELSRLKKQFNASELTDPVDFLYLIADMGALAAQYGYVNRFCRDLKTAQNPVEGYAKFTQYIMKLWGMTALSLSAQGAMDEDPDSYVNGFGMRQWFYQSCVEYGYWQNAHPTQSVRSKLINSKYHQKLCKRLYGITKPVDTSHINKNYYEPLLDARLASRIFFTNGSTDPWLNLSLKKSDVSQNSNLEWFMIEGAAHCDDLRAPSPMDSDSIKKSRQIFQGLMNRWIQLEGIPLAINEESPEKPSEESLRQTP